MKTFLSSKGGLCAAKIVGLVLALSFTAGLQATPLSLEDIINGSIELTQGDKIFGDFGVTISGPATFSASDISVVTTGTGLPGDPIAISFRGPMTTTSTTGVDIALRYSVRTASAAALIAGIGQAFNLTSLAPGGIVGIGETVHKDSFVGVVVAQSTVGFNVTGDITDPPGEPVTGDQLIISPTQAQVFVTKDIFLQANSGQAGPGLIGATIITQTFSQVPEPTTVLLTGAALVGLCFFRRRSGVRGKQ